MIVENYPLGYIKPTIPTSPMASDVSKSDNVTPSSSTSTNSSNSQQDYLVSQIRKRESTLRDISSGKVKASDSAKRQVEKQLDLYTQQLKNVQKDGSSTVSVSNKEVTTSSTSEVKGISDYSVTGLSNAVSQAKAYAPSEGLYVPIDQVPYKPGVSPNIFVKSNDGFVNTNYILSQSDVNQLESSSKSSGVTIQTSTSPSIPGKPFSEVQPSSKVFGTSTPYYDIEKAIGVSILPQGFKPSGYLGFTISNVATVGSIAISGVQSVGRTTSYLTEVIPSVGGGEAVASYGKYNAYASPTPSVGDVVITGISLVTVGTGSSADVFVPSASQVVASNIAQKGIVGLSAYSLVSEVKNVGSIRTPFELSRASVNIGLSTLGVSSWTNRFGDTRFLTPQLEAPKTYANVIDITGSVSNAESFNIPKGTIPNNMNIIFKSSVASYSDGTKFVSPSSGSFSIENVGYISTASEVKGVSLNDREFVTTTTLSGSTRFVAKPGFLYERGIKLDFVNTEHPYFDYGQKGLSTVNNGIKFVDITIPSELDISPYAKGYITNIPLGEPIAGDNFIVYQEYSKFFPIKQGVLVIDNVEQTGEGVSRYVLRDQDKYISSPSIRAIDSSRQSTLSQLEWGSGMVSPNSKVRLALTYEPNLPKFGYEVTNFESVKNLQNIRLNKLSEKLGEIENTYRAKVILEQLPKYVEVESPISGIGLGFIERSSSLDLSGMKMIPSENSYVERGSSFESVSEGSSSNTFNTPSSYLGSSSSFNFVESPKFDIGSKPNVGLAFKSNNMLSQSMNLDSNSILKHDNDYRVSNINFRSSINNVKEDTLVKSKSSQSTDNLFKQRQDNILRTNTISSISMSTNSTTPSMSDVVINKPTPSSMFNPGNYSKSSLNISSIKSKDKSKSKFVVEVRKKGKFVKVGEFENIEQATSKGLEDVKSSASASFRVKSSLGQNVFVQTPFGFSRSKRDQFVIVQPREQRISSFGEVQEISRKGQEAQRLSRGFDARGLV